MKCKCGCGQKIVLDGKRYIPEYVIGHFFKNKKFSKQHRLNLSKSKQKNHNLYWIEFKCPICNKKFERRKSDLSFRRKTKIRYCSKKCYNRAFLNGTAILPDVKGKKNPMFGKKFKHTKATIKKLREQSIGRKHTIETRKLMSKNRIKMLRSLGINDTGNEYGVEFNRILKDFIRKRDQYQCQNKECGIPQKECLIALDCHHIDYNKKNNDPINLIALCNRCHTKSNYNRKYWQEYYENIQIKRKVHLLEKYIR